MRDSRLIDQALDALVERELSQRELAAIEENPYESDPDLAWDAPVAPDLR